MFRALIWKDVRLNRLPLIFAAAMVVVSYAVVVLQFSMDPAVQAAVQAGTWNRALAGVIFAGSVASHAVAQFTLSVLAGNLVASERVDRSAEFLAYTPASRGTILRAKGVLLAAVALGFMLLHLCGMLIPPAFATPAAGTSPATIWIMFAQIAAYGFCGAGIGWMASCMLSSNSSAVLFAIVTPVLVPIATILSMQAIDRHESEQAVRMAAWCALGLAGFLWGTKHYLGRVET